MELVTANEALNAAESPSADDDDTEKRISSISLAMEVQKLPWQLKEAKDVCVYPQQQSLRDTQHLFRHQTDFSANQTISGDRSRTK